MAEWQSVFLVPAAAFLSSRGDCQFDKNNNLIILVTGKRKQSPVSVG